jgi:Flp pilus assembly protein TadD
MELNEEMNEALSRELDIGELQPNILKILSLGHASLTNQKFNKAIDYFNEIILLEPKNESAWHHKGVALFRLRKWSRGLTCFTKASRIAVQKRNTLK